MVGLSKSSFRTERGGQVAMERLDNDREAEAETVQVGDSLKEPGRGGESEQHLVQGKLVC